MAEYQFEAIVSVHSNNESNAVQKVADLNQFEGADHGVGVSLGKRRAPKPTWEMVRAWLESACIKFDILANTDGWGGGGYGPLRPARILRAHIEDIITRGATMNQNYFKHTPETVALMVSALDAMVQAEIIRHARIMKRKEHVA